MAVIVGASRVESFFIAFEQPVNVFELDDETLHAIEEALKKYVRHVEDERLLIDLDNYIQNAKQLDHTREDVAMGIFREVCKHDETAPSLIYEYAKHVAAGGVFENGEIEDGDF